LIFLTQNLSKDALRPVDQDCPDQDLDQPSRLSSRKDGYSNMIQTGDMLGMIGSSFFSLAQSIFAPWTLPGGPIGFPKKSRRNFRIKDEKRRRKNNS